MIDAAPDNFRRRAASPLWGLWIAFAATVVACIHGVVRHEIALASALLAVLTLAAVIRLAASALRIAPHPVDLARLSHAARLVARRRRMAAPSVSFASEPELING